MTMNIGIKIEPMISQLFKKLLEHAVFVHPSTRDGAILRLVGRQTVQLASPSVDMFIFCKVLDVD